MHSSPLRAASLASLLVLFSVQRLAFACEDLVRSCDNLLARCSEGFECDNPSEEPLAGCCILASLNGMRLEKSVNGQIFVAPDGSAQVMQSEEITSDNHQTIDDVATAAASSSSSSLDAREEANSTNTACPSAPLCTRPSPITAANATTTHQEL